jgi:class 3 adenylate cyclase
MRPDVRYVRNGDVSLAYQVAGDGPRDLLLVSGFVSNLEEAWRYPSLSRFLSRLAETSRLILTDRRGSGLSDRFGDAPPQETMLNDLEIVLDEVGSAKATLLGLWDGCETSILFAATYPDRVSSLILCTVSGTQRRAEDYPWAWTDEEWDDWLASIRNGWGTRPWVVKNARWMGPGMLDDPDELDHWMTYTRLAASPSSAEAVMRNSSNTDIRAVLPVVHAPTLILHRLGDQIEPIGGARYVASKMPDARLVELEGDDGIPWIGDTDAILGEIQAFLPQGAGHVSGDRKLATVLFTDIVGSTEKAGELGDAEWKGLLQRHHQVVRAMIARHRGEEVDTAGDGFLVTFDGPARAVRCAREIVDAVRPLGIEIRAGVHTGEVEAIDGKVGGIAVHIGARLASEAAASEVLVSQTVKDLVAGSGLAFEDAGEHELKGIADRWRLYRVAGEPT